MGGMAEAVLRGLAAMEAVGAGDRTVSDVARRLGRQVNCFPAAGVAGQGGWLHREGDEFDLGPRSAVLGVGGPEQRFVGHARAVAHTVAGVTGRHVTVMQHAGTHDFLVAEAAGEEALFDAPNVLEEFPLWATGAGRCLAAQLRDEELDALLPPEPFPALTLRTQTTRAAFDDAVAAVRAGDVMVERGEFDAGHGCVALPWPGPEPLPIGTIALSADSRRSAGRCRACSSTLSRAAVLPGRDTRVDRRRRRVRRLTPVSARRRARERSRRRDRSTTR